SCWTMYSGDVPSTSGHHDSQPPFYSSVPSGIHHNIQGPSSSRDAPHSDNRRSASPQYIEMMPVRVTNGEEGRHGGDHFHQETIHEGMEGGVKMYREGVRIAMGGPPRKINIIPSKKMFKTESYNMKKMINEFWPMQKQRVENMSVKYLREASRNQVLPLARVKKIMKIDENVQKQMIAADAPLLLSVASEMFIEELTLRAWEVTEEAKRKTLQKTDVATACARHDHMDFLIDIIPRSGITPRPKEQSKEGRGQAQMVQIVQGGATMLMKGANTILSEGGPSSSNQQEFSARLESGEEAQVIQIGKPIPLSSQAISQLGLGPLPPPTSHHSHPPLSHPPTSSPSPSSNPQTTVRIPSHLMPPPRTTIKSIGKGGRPVQGGQTPSPSSSQGAPNRSKQ
ncbi:hypothetical protein PMAYCL1PPCAC_23286, partial [Pristionchus mayeri]